MEHTHAAERKAPTVAIVGGGVSGALTAYHLDREHPNARILLIDPAPNAGPGLAYSTPSFKHLLNVPAGNLSALPNEPNDFLTWLQANYDPEATRETFAPRAVFGRYVQSILARARCVEHIRGYVEECRVAESGAMLTLASGRRIEADAVVIATGNFEAATLPGVSKELERAGRYCHNAWRPETYEGLAGDAPVTLLGTGLTAVDVLLRLRELGHRGTVTAISRRAVFPGRHADYRPLERACIPAGTPATCLSYLRAVRAAIRNGADWRAAVDSLRPVSNDLWLALPLKEQRRFRRHLQRQWDVLRHRMAPPVADVIQNETDAGTLVVREGRVHSMEAAAGGARVTIRTAAGLECLTTARAINCTGPNMNYRDAGSPLMNSLFEQGLATAGPLGTGLNTTLSGALIAADGTPSKVLFNLGPGRQGTLLESIAVPEIREQAAGLAKLLSNTLQSSPAVAA